MKIFSSLLYSLAISSKIKIENEQFELNGQRIFLSGANQVKKYEKFRKKLNIQKSVAEKNILKCVDSLLEQDYENIEIILVDDNSSDKTWFLINNLSKNNKNIKSIKGKQLPSNWRGKNWACHQGFNITRGAYLLFMDADTKLTKFAVSSGINQLENDKLEFLSLAISTYFS